MKTLRFIGFALFAILMCLSACSSGGDDPIEPTPKPEVTKSEITIDSSIISNGLSFSNVGGDQSISFTTNENWTLTVASTTSGTTWCTASVTSGTKGSATVKFTVTENTEYENRSVSVTIKSGTASKTFTITQKSADALLITTDKYEVSQEGGTIEIEVKANIDYQMEISENSKDWIKESSSRALTTYKHKLDIAMNEDVEKREGEITFKSGDKVETVKVYQAGGVFILLSQDEYTVSDTGETISVDIKSNVEYSVQMPDVDWITDEASSRGMSSHTLKYAVAPNESYDNRSAEIIFYDKNSDLKDTLKVVQAQKDAIVISEKNISVAKEGGAVEVKVNTNVDFEVQIPSEVTWISQTDSRALTEKSVFLKIAENTSEESRSANIIIRNRNSQLSETIAITQYGNIYIVTLKEAGYLKSLLDRNFLNIKSLKIIGPINGNDIYCLRQMLGGKDFNVSGKLENLDLSDATIVKGGDYYYDNYNIKNKYYTRNNIVGQYMFYECKNLKNIILPNNTILIGTNAFQKCRKLEALVIPNNVTEIDGGAFRYCVALKKMEIPNNITQIHSSTFEGCTNLSEIIIGNRVTLIGPSAFKECSNLKKIKIPDSVVKIDYTGFEGCHNLTEITFGCNINSIDYNAFNGCNSLSYIDISSLETWCNIEFDNAKSNPLYYGAELYLNNEIVTDLIIPQGIKEIKDCSFTGCKSLKTVKLHDEINSIGSSAFADCNAITNFICGNNITQIGGYAFSNCDALTNFELPEQITSMGACVFNSCDKLETVYCKAKTPPNLTGTVKATFSDNISYIYVPSNSVELYKKNWKEYSNIIYGYDY